MERPDLAFPHDKRIVRARVHHPPRGLSPRWLVKVEGLSGEIIGPMYRDDEGARLTIARIHTWLTHGCEGEY